MRKGEARRRSFLFLHFLLFFCNEQTVRQGNAFCRQRLLYMGIIAPVLENFNSCKFPSSSCFQNPFFPDIGRYRTFFTEKFFLALFF